MGSINEPAGEYRQYIPDLTSPRFTTMKEQDAYAYGRAFKTSGHPAWLYGLYQHWCKLYEESFKGITSDGESCSVDVNVVV